MRLTFLAAALALPASFAGAAPVPLERAWLDAQGLVRAAGQEQALTRAQSLKDAVARELLVRDFPDPTPKHVKLRRLAERAGVRIPEIVGALRELVGEGWQADPKTETEYTKYILARMALDALAGLPEAESLPILRRVLFESPNRAMALQAMKAVVSALPGKDVAAFGREVAGGAPLFSAHDRFVLYGEMLETPYRPHDPANKASLEAFYTEALSAESNAGNKERLQRHLLELESDMREACFDPKRWAVPAAYCVSKPRGGEPASLLYYFHGKGGSEKSWLDRMNYTAGIIKAWRKAGKRAPAVAAISFGELWLLSEKNPSPRSGLYPYVKDKVIPHIESAHFERRKLPRLLMGESMGGFNAAFMAVHEPKLFTRVAIVCPAISSLSPFASAEEVAAYVRMTGADPQRVALAQKLSTLFFPDAASWEKAAPLLAGRTLLGPATPALHVSCGDKDEYGWFEGAKAFADLAAARGVTTAWQPLSGGHCVADAAALAAFLLP